MYKIAFILIFFILNSCATNQSSREQFQPTENKIAILYNSKDQNAVELINYILCFNSIHKINSKFVTFETQQDENKMQDVTTLISNGGYQVIISLLNAQSSQMLDDILKKSRITLFSSSALQFKYVNFIDNKNLTLHDNLHIEVDKAYTAAQGKPAPQNALNIYKILSLIQDATHNHDDQLNIVSLRDNIKP
jgi:hypothetical protein